MLVLKVKADRKDYVQIGDDIFISVEEICPRSGGVKIGIHAPRSVKVHAKAVVDLIASGVPEREAIERANGRYFPPVEASSSL